MEACPTDAITHGHGFEIATLNATNLVYRKEQMLAPMPAYQGQNAAFSTVGPGENRTIGAAEFEPQCAAANGAFFV